MSTLAVPYRAGFVTTLRKRAFHNVQDGVISVGVLLVLAWIVWKLLDWAVFNATFGADNAAACADSHGACWSVVAARYRLILFGLYPYDLHWRSALACLSIIVTVVLSCVPLFWRAQRLIPLWIVGFALYVILMDGSLFGEQVTTDAWGGLALTLFMFASVVLLGMPMGLLLALARRSDLPVLSVGAVFLIDFIRSLPLLTTLFTAAIVVPLMLPDWLTGDKIWRVIVAFALFFACYQAEVFRGGFQALPKGQVEAGKALGLGYWQILARIELPQVFRHSLPATINMVVVTFKETAIVIIIGFFDILASAGAAFGTAEWAPYYIEVYAFVGAIYWIFIFSLGQYGEYLKGRMTVAGR